MSIHFLRPWALLVPRLHDLGRLGPPAEILMKRVQYPYKCEKCFYSPPECLPVVEKEEDLLIHYGCNEKLSIQYYQDECAKLQQPTTCSNQAQEATSISCEMCNSSHDNERLFIRHITLRHFTKQVTLHFKQTLGRAIEFA